ncbi:lysophospholipase L1-like esterase [Altererythrobacter atlanticus]|uniref:GDSL-like Lipase/Acylhydrolase n=1 Tax=Croceibacterium atlanticum TaxID=1267766 RepID=A0A0F7KV94_9SPHN|nr:SGNH/GDSL hydrolase family protein [Croceibacterium atlanticum]AKH43101.1 GDSL-like Lipase/Acylhydrolase [Croceibacterium atlanticum]MBB5732195.1 lysophospholipase L1-like esterase [Croceibacterium atlanticum]
MFTRISAIAAVALAGFAAPVQAEWVASWAASPHAPLGTEGPFAAASYDNVTISQILRISEGGEKLRLRFSNRYGPAPLTIGAARVVQIDDAGNEVPGTSRQLTFGGQDGAVIPRGAPFTSDAVKLDLPDLARLKVEIYLPEETGPCTCHLTGMDELAISPPGNHVGKSWEPVSTAQFRAFLTTVEVDSPDANGTIVAFGDSITDGVGSTPGANRRWPDILANRLQDAGMEWAVANAAISGNRVLSPGMGEAALARFDEDVLSLPNVEYLIIFEGVNDIGNRYGPQRGGIGGVQLDQPEIDAAQMIAGYKQLVARARQHGIKVIGSPIGPYKGASYWSEEGEAARQEINDWIVNSGVFDAVIRLDTAFADPADPQKMRDGYHMGDYLHGSDAGLKAVGESIPLSLFEDD